MFQDEDLIQPTDTLLVQELLGNGFENVRHAIGAGAPLVLNGVVQHDYFQSLDSKNMAHFRHPRTAVGQKEDGTIFFIVVDGRDIIAGKNGVKYGELGELMKLHGAEIGRASCREKCRCRWSPYHEKKKNKK